jgi:hypothetical protein
MKKIILLAVALLMTGTIFGHGNGWSKNNKNESENNNQYWQQMNTWRQVMHDTKVEAKNTDKGVNLQVVLPSDEAQKTLTNDFQFSQENLATYFESVEVSLDNLENGWVINFSSSEDRLIKKLQNSGSGLWYEFLQQKMYSIMGSNKGNGFMGEQHMMGNYNGHMGYGPGKMQGGYQGYPGGGSGMNQGDIQGSSNVGPGKMNNNFNNNSMM